MKKLLFSTVFFMFFVSIAYCGSIEDIKNKLNKNTAKKEGKNFSAGKRFKIMKAKIYQKTRYYYKQDGSTVHAVTVTFRIKKMMQGETFISPEVFKMSNEARKYKQLYLPLERSNEQLSGDEEYINSATEQVDDLSIYCDLTAETRVLDFGCGQGRFANGLLVRQPDIKLSSFSLFRSHSIKTQTCFSNF